MVTQQRLEPVDVVLMTRDEAERATAKIVSAVNDATGKIVRWLDALDVQLLEIDQREGWRALGYTSMARYMVARLGTSRQHAYKILDRLRVSLALTAPSLAEPILEAAPEVSHSATLTRQVTHRQAVALKRSPEAMQAALEGAPPAEAARVAVPKAPRRRGPPSLPERIMRWRDELEALGEQLEPDDALSFLTQSERNMLARHAERAQAFWATVVERLTAASVLA